MYWYTHRHMTLPLSFIFHTYLCTVISVYTIRPDFLCKWWGEKSIAVMRNFSQEVKCPWTGNCCERYSCCGNCIKLSSRQLQYCISVHPPSLHPSPSSTSSSPHLPTGGRGRQAAKFPDTTSFQSCPQSLLSSHFVFKRQLWADNMLCPNNSHGKLEQRLAVSLCY